MIEHDEKQHRFYIEDNNEVKGEMTYSIGDHVMVIDHTYVHPDYRNRGYGRRLVESGVEYAKSKQMKMRPTCPYAYNIIDNHHGSIIDRFSNRN